MSVTAPLARQRLDHFSKTYEEARDKFRQFAKSLTNHYQQVEISSFFVKSKVDPNLTVDYLFIPAQKQSSGEPRRLLIVSSGVHGIEGYIGSAIQLLLMDEKLSKMDLSQTGILFLHGINPYGFKYYRRTTEDNIDLNRNFALSTQLFDKKNEGYNRLYEFLNPRGKANTTLSNVLSYPHMLYLVVRHGLAPLRQAILQGQYQHPKGLFFGGTDFVPQKADLERLLLRIATGYDAVFLIDLHTGYGESGKLHLFGHPPKDEATRSNLDYIFEGYQYETGEDNDDFYRIGGSFCAYVERLFHNKSTLSVGFEYGTISNLSLLGSMRSLQIMRLENQGFHYGYTNSAEESALRTLMHELYYPSGEGHENYRIDIMEQTLELFSTALFRFESLDHFIVNTSMKE